MIRNYFFTLFFTLSALIVQAQADYMDIIADKSCECISKEMETNPEISEMQLGICLIQAAKDYKVQLERDYDINLDKIAGADGEKLGEIIGARLALNCPEIIVAASAGIPQEEDENQFTSGKVTAINKDTFVVLNLKDETGKSEKYYWLTFIESNWDLQNSYKQLEGKNVAIEFYQLELFDSRIEEYRMVNIITSLEVGE